MLSRYQQSLISFLVLVSGKALALSSSSYSSPIVTLPYGSFEGKVVGDLVEHLGIPFAAPPIGELRFGLPKPPLPFDGVRQATAFGAACPQQKIIFKAKLFGDLKLPPLSKISEDCLFINVVRPVNASSDKLLPVVFYIYGGGFQVGDTSQYIGNNIVHRSIALDEPVIYVSANYRLNAFGFLGGKEVKEAGIANAGLYDQRFALNWVQKYIAAFGGDPGKVTIWGESAGAMSVGLQLLFDNGDSGGLFTGAIMESGAPRRLPDILDQQKYFDGLVSATSCTGASDRLACLRAVPYAQLMAAIDLSPGMFSYQGTLAWEPMVDGKLFHSNPLALLQNGKYAKVPFIAGNCEDEGTIFTLSTLNVTTNAEFLKYIKEYYFPNISDAELAALANAYPDDVTQGSPFNTGMANALTPEFKRFAALQGDRIFQAPRRFLLEIASKTQPAYSYRYMRGASTPVLGAAHGTDIPYFFGMGKQTDSIAIDSIIYFAHKRNPNAPRDSISLLRDITWEKWSSSEETPPLLTFVDPVPSMTIPSKTSLSISYLRNVAWQKRPSCEVKPPFLAFVDPVPGMTITSDTYRSKEMKLIIELLKK